ncbi:class I SAM-dependent methyltransferase [Cesiribacter andamanensis]|uniref:Ribosomal RNA large subunit methyltransferase I n=1 Tax=Cesiribacter andamanensis AMV16 TaxID=1279009 RepID=M7NFS9_9BACT|nr:class I SAM-dependent methyltransferase [Cesiribacter andamanensis]EMR00675.1 Ribosomal RNA large subunit methyltransferase I [Cesiribacter andamanensis AMV16]
MATPHTFTLLSPADWQDYELLDCGDFEKLERFGRYILARPEPQAVWEKALPEAEWERQAHARYVREKGRQENIVLNAEKGAWQALKNMPEQWQIGYRHAGMQLQFRLALTAFGHIGVFPEQAENWNWIYQTLQQLPIQRPRVLNLFAYTGGASLAAAAAGADVTHLDSIRQTVSWSNQNRELSQLPDIRWVVEDAMKFVRREAKRGNRYHGIIMDPPSYGRGPKGEKWVLEQDLNELVALAGQLLEPANSFLLLNLYSMGLSALVMANLVRQHMGVEHPQMGELYLQAKSGHQLPLGTYLRFIR